MKKINLLTNKYLKLYKKKGLTVKKRDLEQRIFEIRKRAERNYKNIKGEKSCSLNLYLDICTRKIITRNLISKEVYKLNLNRNNPVFKASNNYFNILPYEKHQELHDQLFATKAEDRKKVWQNFNLPTKQLEKEFKKIILARIEFAKSQGFNSFFDLNLERYKIPPKKFKAFNKNIDSVINYYQQQLPQNLDLPIWFYSKFNLPCFMCQQVEFPFKGLGEAIKEIVENNQLLDDFKRKINIEIGESSKVNYQEKTDTFKIIINKRLNLRHQIAELIHELAHIIVYLENFKKEVNPLEKGNYWREKRTIQKELKILEQVGEPLRANLFNEGLLVFWQIMFQIKICNNKKQNLSKIYAQVFNQCFKDGRQKNNPTFILQGNITLNSFFQLPHAVAQANFIEKI